MKSKMKLAPMNPAPPVTRSMLLLYLQRREDLFEPDGVHAARPWTFDWCAIAAAHPLKFTFKQMPLIAAREVLDGHLLIRIGAPEGSSSEEDCRAGTV